jgi:DNA-binding transcriptional ArsR family regulator
MTPVEVEVDNEAALHALAEPHRAAIVRLLVDKQLAVKQLVAATGMAQPLVSHHLRVLRQAALVESTVCSGMTVYRLRADTLGVLAGRLASMAEKAARTSGVKPC